MHDFEIKRIGQNLQNYKVTDVTNNQKTVSHTYIFLFKIPDIIKHLRVLYIIRLQTAIILSKILLAGANVPYNVWHAYMSYIIT